MKKSIRLKSASKYSSMFRSKSRLAVCLSAVCLFQLQASATSSVLGSKKFANPLTKTFSVQTITGTVTDESGIPIPQADILIEGTNKGTTTDFDGKFSIDVKPGDVLVVSFIGLVTQKIVIADQVVVDVELLTDQNELNEVVVIGYGTAKKSDLTGSVTRVTAKSFEKQPLSRVEEALQGRTAGVSVQKNSGAPGAPVKIRVRGANSITGSNDPLVVIDGILGGDLTTLNPNDIETMDVLKDASATAVYGVRGSNGVIVVTTKKGKGKPKFNVDFFTTIAEVPDLLPTLGAADFARIENTRAGSAVFSDEQIADFERNGGTNYQDEIFQTAISNNLQLSLNGGTDKINYFLSGNYVNQEGVVITTGFERYSLRSNIRAKVTDKFTVGTNIFASRATFINELDQFAGLAQGGLITSAVGWNPTLPVRDENGEFISSSNLASLTRNPVETINLSNFERVIDRFNATANLSYDFNDAFNYTLIVGGSTTNSTRENVIANTLNFNRLPNSRFNSFKQTTHQVSNILNWKKSLGDHNIKATGVFEFSGINAVTRGFTTQELQGTQTIEFAELGSTVDVPFTNINNRLGLQSLVGRLEYNYNKEFFLTSSIRRDESSRFASSERVGYFPSVALSYNFSNKSFIEESNVLSSLKLRAGWGQVGNQGVDFLGRFATLARSASGTDASFDGETTDLGFAITRIANENLGWETTDQFNAGIDLSFLDNRLDLTLDVYHKNTDDLLLERVLIPVLAGDGTGPNGVPNTVFENVGEVQNRGFDISLGGRIFDNEDFKWNSNLALSYNQNEVKKLNDDNNIIGNFESIDGRNTPLNIIEVGKPLGQLRGAVFLGTWKSDERRPDGVAAGAARYLRDENGENIIGSIGNGVPTTTWGWNNTLNYKNWDLSFLFQAAHDFEVYNLTRNIIVGATGNQRSFLAPEQLNQFEAGVNESEIPTSGDNIASTRYIEKGDFVRLSNLSVGYTLKDFVGFESVNFYASAQNVFIITDYSGYDPELTSQTAIPNRRSNGDAAAGIDAGAYPNPRTYTVGVKFQL